MHVLTVVQLGG